MASYQLIMDILEVSHTHTDLKAGELNEHRLDLTWFDWYDVEHCQVSVIAAWFWWLCPRRVKGDNQSLFPIIPIV